jgi:hypothetical protein
LPPPAFEGANYKLNDLDSDGLSLPNAPSPDAEYGGIATAPPYTHTGSELVLRMFPTPDLGDVTTIHTLFGDELYETDRYGNRVRGSYVDAPRRSDRIKMRREE